MSRPVRTPFSPDLRSAIASEAELLFAERGFDGACIREIAHRAGVTTALIYHYYGNKGGLYLHLMETTVSSQTVQIEGIAASSAAPPEKVRRVVRVLLDSYREYPQRIRLIHRAVDERHPSAVALAERWFSRMTRALRTIAEEGIKKKLFKPLSPHVVPFMILALVVHAFRSEKIQERITPGFPAAALFETLEEFILTLLVIPQEKGKRNPLENHGKKSSLVSRKANV
jgi:AcrR family transcriptional regulator